MVACQRLGCDVTGFLHFEAERRGRDGGETEGVGGVVDGGVCEWEGGSMVLSCPVGANDASDGKSRPSFPYGPTQQPGKTSLLCSSPNTLDNNDYLIERG